MLTQFLNWYVNSRSPTAVTVRTFARRHHRLRRVARGFLFTICYPGYLPRLIREWVRSLRDHRLRAIMSAREVGGGIAVSDLEIIFLAAKRAVQILCIADGLELEQIAIVVRAAGAGSLECCRGRADVERLAENSRMFDLIMIVPTEHNLEFEEQLVRNISKSCQVIRIDINLLKPPSSYCGIEIPTVPAQPRIPVNRLREKIERGDRLRIVFVNDYGLQYGAGIAMRRQILSFLLKGWDVSMVAGIANFDVRQPWITGVKQLDTWQGMHGIVNAETRKDISQKRNIELLATRVRFLMPDAIVVGNVHAMGWQTDVLGALRDVGPPVFAYMHDTYWVTGRCAQPGACMMFRTGCNETCPTPKEYPSLSPERIAEAWRSRGRIFTGPAAGPLIANSNWTHNVVLQRFGDAAPSAVIHLGLDHELFSPIPKAVARRLLRVPDGKPVILMGSVDVHNQWKGGALFHELLRILRRRNDIEVILFGQSSDQLSSARSFGFVHDERLMPFIYSAADIFVTTASAESFGQTLLEASSCALPVVALDVGGIGDIVTHEETGLLVQQHSSEALSAAIDRLIKDPAMRERFGANGRARVEQNFTLIHQADAWVDYFKRVR